VHEILDPLDLTALVDEFPADGTPALFCLERDPPACHRSLVADRLVDEFGFAVVHLLPPD